MYILTPVATKLENLCTVTKCTPIKPPAPAFSQKYELILANSCISVLYPMLVAVVSAFFGSANENENWYKITCMGEHDCLLLDNGN